MKTLNRQDLEDMLLGAVILGAGGGGEIAEGRAMIDAALAAGKTFDLVSLDEVPDTALICTPYLLGAITPLTPDEERMYAGLQDSSTNPLLQAYAEFQEHLGQEFYGTTPCELGGSNTAAAFFPAVMHGHKIIDADPAGRAVPEITHSTYYLAGLPAAPIYAVNQFGESFLIDKVKDDQRAETLVRALSQVSRNTVAAIDHALPMRDLRKALIPGTISKAIAMGAVCRHAMAAGADSAARIAAAGGGAVVFMGTVSAVTYKTDQGFTIGHMTLQQGQQKMTISVKNENMACWLDGRVVATVPDLICLFDVNTGAPIPNPDVTDGQDIAVVILPSPEPFTSPRGLSIFGPAYAGVDAAYQSPLASHRETQRCLIGRACAANCHEKSIPPLMSMFVPVMKALSPVARNSTKFAVSSVFPWRFSGAFASNPRRPASGVCTLWKSVSIMPGQSALTRMSGPNSLANPLVMVITAPLDVAYATAPGPPPSRPA